MAKKTRPHTKADLLQINKDLTKRIQELSSRDFCANIPQNFQVHSGVAEPGGVLPRGPATSGVINRPTISESANRVHDALDKLHSLLDVLTDRLGSVRQAIPATPAEAPSPPNAPCSHIGCLEGARDRVINANEKITSLIEALMI